MYDLNTLIDPASALAGRVSLQEAVGISSKGWIVVNGTDSRDPRLDARISADSFGLSTTARV